MQSLNPLLITSGDPAGIGPEVTHKALSRMHRRREVLNQRPVIVLGDAFLYVRHLVRPQEMQNYHFVPVEDFLDSYEYLMKEFRPRQGACWRPVFVDCGARDDPRIALGKPSKLSGERAGVYLGAAVEMLQNQFADCICTAPICKSAMTRKDFPYPGHTELFGDVYGVAEPVMMLMGADLRVTLVTIHEPVSKLPKLVTKARVLSTILTTWRALRDDFGIKEPRIGVCGLNPHAGESGRFGREEQRSIAPAIEAARDKHMNVTGPLAADSAFAVARKGRFDAVVAMYHDQGLVAVKTLAFDSGVNFTLGLPIVRTSPDHGTAYDIAGTNKADERPMLNAIATAHDLSLTRRQAAEGGRKSRRTANVR